MSSDPDGDPLQLATQFESVHGRRPRVLHIGNIANNAFLNAKILNQAGYDCDVMCADYYHIMGCPEWEEADFIGTIADQFSPDWMTVDLQGYERPHWFAQGPQRLCLDYLLAKRSGDARSAASCWDELAAAARRGLDNYNELAVEVRVSGWRDRMSQLGSYLAVMREHPDAYDLTASKLRRMAEPYGLWAQALRSAALPPSYAMVAAMRLVGPKRLIDLTTPWLTLFREQFPDRPDQLTVDDVKPFLFDMRRWKRLCAAYDLIVGYATEGIRPLLAGARYFALEHGTIREIPYRDSGEGRRTALSYRMAEHVFVTNFDCLESAARLAPGKFTQINHPFDEDAGLAVTGWEALRAELQRELDCDTVFFFPTRHDWVAGTGYADKANDVFLRAFAELRRRGHRVGMVCGSWGANVPQSKALLAELGCAAHVRWGSPLPTVQFERMSRAAHCVVDQFMLGAFGGVMFKAMAVGAPMLTYLNEDQVRRQYAEPPPVINCRTTDEVVSALSEVLATPGRLAEYGAASRDWMRRYHGKEQTVRLQAAQFRAALFSTAGSRRLARTV